MSRDLYNQLQNVEKGINMTQMVEVPVGREPEGRIDPITGSVVIVSASRSAREGKRSPQYVYKLEEVSNFKDGCHFCPAHEERTPEELFSLRTDFLNPSSWTARVFPNKFPILALEAKGNHDPQNIALGVNEIVLETRRHNGFLSSLAVDEIAGAFSAVTARYFSLRGDPRLEWFSVFKNFGKTAGASMEHPHIQLVVAAHIPTKFRERFIHAQQYFWDTKSCLCCDQIERHRKLGQVILETRNFILLVPYEARMPYHMRIFPKKHGPSFAHEFQDNGGVREDFAYVLKSAVFLYRVAVQGENFGLYSDPMYNFYIETSPYRDDHAKSVFHWRLEFHGKTTFEAGYEQHTGEFVNPAYPEEIAQQLKEIARIHLVR